MLLQVDDLQVCFATDDGMVTAVREVSFTVKRGQTVGRRPHERRHCGVSFTVKRGQTVGLVGESGCGKSVTGLSLLRLIPPSGQIKSGRIVFSPTDGSVPTDITKLPNNGKKIRQIRGNQMAMVFQEPMSSLNPVYTIGQQIGEAVMLHRLVSKREARARSIEMLEQVGMPAPHLRVDEYPHHLSGGMRQRAMIALALSCDPELLIADEPTTALDVTVQAQIIDLLRSRREETGMATLMISHDLGVIADLCDEVLVMYAGRVVERGSAVASAACHSTVRCRKGRDQLVRHSNYSYRHRSRVFSRGRP